MTVNLTHNNVKKFSVQKNYFPGQNAEVLYLFISFDKKINNCCIFTNIIQHTLFLRISALIQMIKGKPQFKKQQISHF